MVLYCLKDDKSDGDLLIAAYLFSVFSKIK